MEIQIAATSEVISKPGFYQGDRPSIEAVETQLAAEQKKLAECYARWELLENQ